MATLPTQGGNSGTWGTDLNTWLLVGHNADGTTAWPAVNTQTDSYTGVLSDAGKVIEMDKATANTYTVPPVASVAYAVGTVKEIYQKGAGQTTIVAGAGVTIRNPIGLKLRAQYSSASLRMRATNEWVLSGDTAA